MVGKMLAASLTIGIGGSGGVFAPSLFTGAMAGTAFGIIAQHLFGPAAGAPAIYGVIAMGAVFAARRPGAAYLDRQRRRDDRQLQPDTARHARRRHRHRACPTR